MISESTINKVRELAIGDVLEPYVRLSRKGSTLMGICPFHEERTGSFSVSPGKNLFHCFSCNRGGDAITFIMEKENLSFMEAIEFLARRHNIPIEYVEGQDKEQVAKIQHKETLLAILGHVQDFFVGSLLMPDSDESRLAREYAYGRWPEEFCWLLVSGTRRVTEVRSWSSAGQKDWTRMYFSSWVCSGAEMTVVSMPCSDTG